MKRTLVISTILLLAVTIIAGSCKKKTSDPTTFNPSQLDESLAGLRGTPQSFTVQAGRDTAIYGSRGTLLHFYKYSFKDSLGNPVVGSTVTINLTEMYSPGDMIANRTSATCNGNLLQSGGQVNLVATANGHTVYANKYGLGFKNLSTSTTGQMELYYGNHDAQTGAITWNIADTTKKGTISTADSIAAYHIFDSCTSFAWINCDHPYNWGPGTQFTNIQVVMPDASYNAEVFIVYPEINHASMLWLTASTNTFSGSTAIPVFPIGKLYKIVAIGYKNNTSYYYETSGTVTSGMTLHAVMAQMPLSDIETRLAGL